MASEVRNLEILLVDSPVEMGQVCQVWCQWEYWSDTIINKTIYVAIGNKGLTFDELIHHEETISLVSTYGEWTTHAEAIEITIASPLATGNLYDVYAKLYGDGNDIWSEALLDAIQVGSEIPSQGWIKMIPSAVSLSIALDTNITPGGWIKMIPSAKYLTVILPSPTEEEGTSILPWILIGGGAIIALAAVIPKDKVMNAIRKK